MSVIQSMVTYNISIYSWPTSLLKYLIREKYQKLVLNWR